MLARNVPKTRKKVFLLPGYNVVRRDRITGDKGGL